MKTLMMMILQIIVFRRLKLLLNNLRLKTCTRKHQKDPKISTFPVFVILKPGEICHLTIRDYVRHLSIEMLSLLRLQVTLPSLCPCHPAGHKLPIFPFPLPPTQQLHVSRATWPVQTRTRLPRCSTTRWTSAPTWTSSRTSFTLTRR